MDYRTLQFTFTKIAKTGTKVLCIILGEKTSLKRFGEVEIRFIPYQKNPK